jgi:uncharacterized protein (TIGR02270 family)
LWQGVISALGWLPFDQVEKYAKQFLLAESAALRHIGLAAFAIHRQDPGQALIDALKSEDALLKARAFKTVGELGRRDLLAYLQTNFREENTKCRFYASWSAALLGDTYACSILQSIAQSDSPYREEATKMCADCTLKRRTGGSKNWLKTQRTFGKRSAERARSAIRRAYRGCLK